MELKKQNTKLIETEYNGGCQGTRDEGNGDVLVKGTNFQLQYE